MSTISAHFTRAGGDPHCLLAVDYGIVWRGPYYSTRNQASCHREGEVTRGVKLAGSVLLGVESDDAIGKRLANRLPL